MPSATVTTPVSLAPTSTPFHNIGLAFSGGGYRAASFCLGTLSYMNEVAWEETQGVQTPLLQNVSYISSASGGTITSAMYALHQSKGTSFGACYKDIFEQLEGTKLLDRVTAILNSDTCWKDCPDKQRNLINAFAIAYNELLFKGACISDLAGAVPACHLDEVCFNATDLYRGLVFQQEIKMKEDPYPDKDFWYGNYILHLEYGMAAQLRLGDVLAASSCFPAGFEPIIFPADFAHGSLSPAMIRAATKVEPQEIKWEELDFLYPRHKVEALLPVSSVEELQLKLKKLQLIDSFEVGLMDGGIDDNQGIDSIMRASNRRTDHKTSFREFDLMLINDVGSYFMDPFHPAAGSNPGGLSIYSVLGLSAAGLLAGIAGFFYTSYNHALPLACIMLLSGLSTMLVVLGAAIIAIVVLVHWFVAGMLKPDTGLDLDKNFTPAITRKLFHFFGKTPVLVVFKMIKTRISSLLTLNNDVFLKRVRQLLYAQFLDNGHASFRMKTNHVYDLSFSNDIIRHSNDPNNLAPSRDMQIIAQCAFGMSTTLWFDNSQATNYNQAALIACGQFTTCYNLLVYISKMKVAVPGGISFLSTLPEAEQTKVGKLEAQLQAHYNAFKEDPFWLYNQSGQRFSVSGFVPMTMNSYAFPAAFDGLRGSPACG